MAIDYRIIIKRETVFLDWNQIVPVNEVIEEGILWTLHTPHFQGSIPHKVL